MIRLIAALLVSFVATPSKSFEGPTDTMRSAMRPAQTFTVAYSTGGLMRETYAMLNHAKTHRVRVMIDGECHSACTLFLVQPDACYTKRASFWFHAIAYDHGRGPIDRQGNAVYLARFPAQARDWIAATLGSKRLVPMPAAILARFFGHKACPEAVPYHVAIPDLRPMRDNRDDPIAKAIQKLTQTRR